MIRKEITVGMVMTKVFTYIIIFSFVFWVFVSPQYMRGYNASIIDKVNRLESINDPKIILVGNSSLAFGIRSDMIEEATGMKVVNLGLHASLGDEFHENIAKLNINPGDVIIECPTEFCGYDTTMQSHILAWETIENHISLWKLISIKEWDDMFIKFPYYFKRCIGLYLEQCGNRHFDTCYDRGAFNEYGDNVYADEHDEEYVFSSNYVVEIPEISDEYIDRLNKFNKYIEEKGAKLYIAGYPIACEMPEDYYDEFESVERELQTKMDCKLISDYKDYMYPYDLFYDTKYHLNKHGAIVRTNQMINDLQAVIE